MINGVVWKIEIPNSSRVSDFERYKLVPVTHHLRQITNWWNPRFVDVCSSNPMFDRWIMVPVPTSIDSGTTYTKSPFILLYIFHVIITFYFAVSRFAFCVLLSAWSPIAQVLPKSNSPTLQLKKHSSSPSKDRRVKSCNKKNSGKLYTIILWLFNIAMENGPFIDDFPINTSIYKGFSMAMLNNQMVAVNYTQLYLSSTFLSWGFLSMVSLKSSVGTSLQRSQDVALVSSQVLMPFQDAVMESLGWGVGDHMAW